MESIYASESKNDGTRLNWQKDLMFIIQALQYAGIIAILVTKVLHLTRPDFDLTLLFVAVGAASIVRAFIKSPANVDDLPLRVTSSLLGAFIIVLALLPT